MKIVKEKNEGYVMKIIKPAHPLVEKRSIAQAVQSTACAFYLMNEQYAQMCLDINTLKPYLHSVAYQSRYAVACVRAKLVLGLMHAHKTMVTYSPATKSFHRLKAHEYLGDVALQDLYLPGQQCALAILRSMQS